MDDDEEEECTMRNCGEGRRGEINEEEEEELLQRS